jgi:hypothetical protein
MFIVGVNGLRIVERYFGVIGPRRSRNFHQGNTILFVIIFIELCVSEFFEDRATAVTAVNAAIR